MIVRTCTAVFWVLATVAPVFSQAPAAPTNRPGQWQNSPPARASISSGTVGQGTTQFSASKPAQASGQPAGQPANSAGGARAVIASSNRVTRVTSGNGVLPNGDGQIWREYDIEPYTSRVTGAEKPQQAIVDWILRETGTDAWFSPPLGVLNAQRNKLTVYHTPDMQRVVSEVVDRFVGSEAERQVLGLHIVTIGSPNWRSKAHRIMTPVEVQTPGVSAWLLSRENAAILLAQLRKRTDFKSYGSPNLAIHNGQSAGVQRKRPKNYVRSARLRDQWTGYELVMGQLEEGFSLQFSPLMSLDKSTLEAVIKIEIDQVEKLVPVVVEVPSGAPQPQRVQIQVPQVVSGRLHERFRWPADQVLLISGGVSATPAAAPSSLLGTPVPNPFSPTVMRADALLFIEYKGKASQALVTTPTSSGTVATGYRGRY